MNEIYHIEYVEKEDETASKVMWAGIQNHMKEQVGDPAPHRLCFVIYSAEKEIVGGVIGDQYWDWIYIDLMWVKEELRGHGYGERLLAKLENEARDRGVRYIYLNTFSFQAPGFYQKYGYQVFGRLANFPAGQQRYFLTKKL